jgi:uncharacterized delta-60 repeat protein
MKYSLLLAIAFASITSLSAQNLTVDPTFHSPVALHKAYISTMVKQPDGKILVAGEIFSLNQIRQHGLVRINSDGSVDNTFQFLYSSDPWVMDVELLGDGDVVILTKTWELDPSHSFFTPSTRVLRLSSSGAIEKDIEVEDFANVIAAQDDGKVLIGGNITNGIKRYNADLTPDNTFNSSVSVNEGVTDIKVISDKIFVTGPFDKVNGVTKNDIVKLNLNGTIDNSFDTGAGTDDYIQHLAFQSDGKIIPAQTYINQFDGHQAGGIIRLNANGSVDETFSALRLNGPFGTPAITEDGIYISSFIDLDGTPSNMLVRIKSSDGSLDETFTPIPTDNTSTSMTIIAHGNHLIISSEEGANDYGLSRFDLNGVADTNFNPEIAALGMISVGDYLDGKLLIGGDFIRIDGHKTFGIARISDNGTIDPTFSIDEDHGPVRQLKVLDDNSVLVSTGQLFKVDENGDVRNDFDWTAPSIFLSEIVKFIELENGQFMTGSYGTVGRINADGSNDDSFDLGPFNHSSAFDFDMQGDNVIYGGYFDDILGVQVNNIARITKEGTFDNTFDTGDGIGPQSEEYRLIQLVKVLDNGEVLLAGHFSEFDGHEVPHGLVKVSANGAFDETFNNNQKNAPAPEPGTFYRSTVYQLGSKVYIRGPYGIYVVNTDGTVDETFNLPITVNGITDMIIVLRNEPGGGRVKTDVADLYAFGEFTVNGNVKTLVKMTLNDDETVTGINEEALSDLSMKIFPQPVSDNLNILVGDAKGKFQASILDISGKGTKEFQFTTEDYNQATQLDLSQTTAGFYLLKVTSESGKTAYRKFVKVY